MKTKMIVALSVLGLFVVANCQKSSAQPAKTAPKPATSTKASTDAKAGLYIVWQSAAEAAKLVPRKGDAVLKAKAKDGQWHLLAIKEGIGVEQVKKVTRRVLIGVTHYTLQLNASGTARLARLTKAHTGSRLAFLLDGSVLIAPEIKTTIDAGQFQVPCAGPLTSCHSFFDGLAKRADTPKSK